MNPVSQCRAYFDTGATRSIEWRKKQLSALEDLLVSERDVLCAALATDLGKPEAEAWGTDLYPALAHCRHVRKNLAKWVKPRRVRLPVSAQPGKAYTLAEPLGVCLLLVPWNYPVLLSLTPLATILAAGNAAVLKPSELAPATSKALAASCHQYLDANAVRVVEGGVSETESLLTNRFDHILFTGSARVGRIVSAAAAQTLTPITLELGGKSPALVDGSADLSKAAKRIAWGKFLNAGQSCISPDYVLVDQTVVEQFLTELTSTITSFFGNDPRKSRDLGRIIDVKNVSRLSALLDGTDPEKILIGGTIDEETRYVAPTVVVNPGADSALMSDEIFGPILPVISTHSVEESLEFTSQYSKPLALYLFSNDAATKEHVLKSSTSGTVGINHTMFQLAVPGLPFGGVGESGHGRYHGKIGFDRFSNTKSVVDKPVRPEIGVIYPPLSRIKKRVLHRILR